MIKRPDFSELKSSEDFLKWYWLKSEMIELCGILGLPHNGQKFDLRDRIAYALDHGGALMPQDKKSKAKSHFNWARAQLTLETKITDNISFGPNFRRFMKSEIGPSFQCHSDFMNWVKGHVGSTLAEAIEAWHQLEQRKDDPSFRREIAPYNMYNQYLRDFSDANPGLSLQEAKLCWAAKKQLPMKNQRVQYEDSDLNLIK